MPSVTRAPRATAPDSRRPRVEDALLEATERQFEAGVPYTHLSVGRLCEEAGIARSTFYVYFRDKGDLIARLAERLLEALAEPARAWWDPGSSREQLRGASRGLIERYREHAAVLAALVETAAYDAELRAVQEALVERYAEPLRELIEHRRAEGQPVRDVPATETVSSLAWMIQGACYHLPTDASAGRIERLAEALTAIVWHALYPDSVTDGGQGR